MSAFAQITQAKTATEAVQATLVVLNKGGAAALLADNQVCRVVRQAIHDCDQRRNDVAKGILARIPPKLKGHARRTIIPRTCNI